MPPKKHLVAFAAVLILLASVVAFKAGNQNQSVVPVSSLTPTLIPIATPTGTGSAQLTMGTTKCLFKQVNANDPQAVEPDSNCTSGALNVNVTQATIASTICTVGYTATIRPPVNYTNTLKVQSIKDYGYSDTNIRDYEEDHFIPLELGGSPTDPKNLWAEFDAGKIPNEKDKVENYLHQQVCTGNITLQAAQNQIRTDWYAVYRTLTTK